METVYLFDVGGAILAFGVVFWLAGGPAWLEEKVRQLRIDNDMKAAQVERMRIENKKLKSSSIN